MDAFLLYYWKYIHVVWRKIYFHSNIFKCMSFFLLLVQFKNHLRRESGRLENFQFLRYLDFGEKLNFEIFRRFLTQTQIYPSGALFLVGVKHYCFFFFENPNKKIMVDLGRFRWFFEICHFVEIFNKFSKIIHFKDISKFLSEIGQIQNTHILMKQTIHFNISILLWRIKKNFKKSFCCSQIKVKWQCHKKQTRPVCPLFCHYAH